MLTERFVGIPSPFLNIFMPLFHLLANCPSRIMGEDGDGVPLQVSQEQGGRREACPSIPLCQYLMALPPPAPLASPLCPWPCSLEAVEYCHDVGDGVMG